MSHEPLSCRVWGHFRDIFKAGVVLGFVDSFGNVSLFWSPDTVSTQE